jgi:hypothetical protein
LGYLGQLASCDIFVCLDTVQFNRREWQNRNRIVSRNGKIDYLSVNIEKNSRKSTMSEITISKVYDPEKIKNRIASYYAKCPRAQEGFEIAQPLYAEYHRPGRSLSDANIEQIRHLARLMGLSTHIERASALESGLEWTTPTDRLVGICRSLGATSYLSSPGASNYMERELYKFWDVGIDVYWHRFSHFPYVGSGPFISHLSCVDFLHHQGIDKLLPYVVKCSRFVPASE